MKRLFLSTLIAASSVLGMSQAQALELEVAPLHPRMSAEVLGLRMSVDGRALSKDAIVFTGKAAKKVAQGAGIAINTSTHMLVATGEEVTSLLDNSIEFGLKAGQTALIKTSRFSKMALRETLHIASGAGRLTVKAADEGFELVSNVVRNAGRMSLVVVANAGQFTLNSVEQTGNLVSTVTRFILRMIGIYV